MIPPLSGFAIWLCPPKDSSLSSLLDSVRNTFPTPRFPPHITILGEVELDLPELVRRITNVVQDVPEFDVKARKVAFGSVYWRSVMIEMDGGDQIVQLEEKIRKEFGSRYNQPFYPHLSVCYGIEDQNLRDKIKAFVEEGSWADGQNWKDAASWKADRICVADMSKPVDQWDVIAEIHLKQ